MTKLEEIYKYREMIVSLVQRDLKGRYKNSMLGFFWSYLNPLLQLVVYTFVFSIVMRNNIEKFYLFLFVALVPWMFFSTALNTGAGCIVHQADMVKKIYFPREILPIVNVPSGFVNMLLSFVVVFAVLLISGFGINLRVIWFLPVVMLIEYFLTLGMVFLVSSVTVYLRDIEYMLSILTLAWQFLTPVMYSIEMVPERYLTLYRLNPMTPIIEAYRSILYYKTMPNLLILLESAGFAVLFMIIGVLVFEKLQRRFVEEL